MARIPVKLKKDPIAEAIFEIRFTSGGLPEVVVGTLAAHWEGFIPQRLAAADIPATIRTQDPNLQYQPLLELRRSECPRLIKIGEKMLSYHALPPYPGWSILEPELNVTIDFLFSSLNQFEATRLGLRYVNVLTDEHFIENVNSLSLAISVADAPLGVPMNLNYLETHGSDYLGLVRLASKDFVGNPSPGLSALVDVDVFTPPTFRSTDPVRAKAWLNEAHIFEKSQFFRLFSDDWLDKMEEK